MSVSEEREFYSWCSLSGELGPQTGGSGGSLNSVGKFESTKKKRIIEHQGGNWGFSLQKQDQSRDKENVGSESIYREN